MKRLIILLMIIGCADTDIILNNIDNNNISSENLNIMTWNIENFPKNTITTVLSIASIIPSLNVDIIALQEIINEEAFGILINQLGDNWIGHRSGTSSSTYQELAYLINTEHINIINVYTILENQNYYFAYRSPYVLEVQYNNQKFIIINNHLKCCGDGLLNMNDTGDEEYRRLIAIQLLTQYIEENYNNEKVIILGDLNDSVTDDEPNMYL